MGYELFVAVGRCKKHPQHRQSPGVCSCCLREKLSYVVNINNNFTASNSTAASLFWSSSSHIASPNHSHHQQQEQQQQEQTSTSLKVISGQKLSTNLTRKGIKKDELEFKRSRSMEVVIRKKFVDDEVIVEDDKRFNKKKFGRGFWLRLLNKPIASTNKRNDKVSMMMHYNKNMTEKRTQRV